MQTFDLINKCPISLKGPFEAVSEIRVMVREQNWPDLLLELSIPIDVRIITRQWQSNIGFKLCLI